MHWAWSRVARMETWRPGRKLLLKVSAGPGHGAGKEGVGSRKIQNGQGLMIS